MNSEKMMVDGPFQNTENTKTQQQNSDKQFIRPSRSESSDGVKPLLAIDPDEIEAINNPRLRKAKSELRSNFVDALVAFCKDYRRIQACLPQ